MELPKPETQESSEARANDEAWKCSRCGRAIKFEDRDTYRESGRCAQCHYEVDTESGTITNL
jgi:DNA-directed RNA polymerase subunit RPC12/RpoP